MYKRIKKIFEKSHLTTPVLMQMEETECGACALGMILGYYKCYVPLEKLRILCGVSRDGSKAVNILAAARYYGMNAQGAECDVADLNQVTLPCIIFWQFEHFVVLEGFNEKYFYLNDPAIGRYILTREDFKKGYTGVLLMITPGPDFKPQGHRKTFWNILTERLQGTKKVLTFLLLVSFTLVIPGIVIPGFSKLFIDNILSQGFHNLMFLLIIGLSTTAGLRAILSYIQKKYLLHFETKLYIHGSAELFWRILKLPIMFFDHRYAGDIEERMGANNRIASILSGDLSSNLIGLFSIAFYAIVMLFVSPPLTLIGITMTVLNFGIFYYLSQKIRERSLLFLQQRGKLMGTELNGIDSMETIKCSQLEDSFFRRWAGFYAKANNNQLNLAYLNQLLQILTGLLSSLNQLLILGFGSYFIIQGKLTVGTLVAFQTLLSSFNEPINTLLRSSTTLQEIQGDLIRLDDIYSYPGIEKEKRSKLQNITDKPLVKNNNITLEMKDIVFGYSPLEDPLIIDFNLKITPGKCIALIGRTGSGKSTIAKLATGLYRPWSGKILLDKNSIYQIDPISISSLITFVDQELFLFEGTIEDNLTLWDNSIPEENLKRAIQDAALEEVIYGRNLQLKSVVREKGGNFSSGERQRLDIARALARDPSILILDEATANLDALTESKIIENLKKRNLSLLIIAHRLSTIQNADEIIVLEKGEIQEKGSPSQLLSVSGHYHEYLNVGQNS